GDMISVDVDKRSLTLNVPDDELARRRAGFVPRPPRLSRGYGALFALAIGQADEGCDFDFLLRGEKLPEPEIH
ncbi:MAG TPA: dihydroxy-acid dehydratase, partial [Roseiarcus sp.]|nr:dihydroxy-acid dehydratase [Roseiarcus sp.]